MCCVARIQGYPSIGRPQKNSESSGLLLRRSIATGADSFTTKGSVESHFRLVSRRENQLLRALRSGELLSTFLSSQSGFQIMNDGYLAGLVKGLTSARVTFPPRQKMVVTWIDSAYRDQRAGRDASDRGLQTLLGSSSSARLSEWFSHDLVSWERSRAATSRSHRVCRIVAEVELRRECCPADSKGPKE